MQVEELLRAADYHVVEVFPRVADAVWFGREGLLCAGRLCDVCRVLEHAVGERGRAGEFVLLQAAFDGEGSFEERGLGLLERGVVGGRAVLEEQLFVLFVLEASDRVTGERRRRVRSS